MPPEILVLARRKAALTRFYGHGDPRTLAAASQLRLARALAEIEVLTDDERAEIAAMLAAAR